MGRMSRKVYPCPLGKAVSDCGNMRNGVCRFRCQPILPQCDGCDKIENGYCRKYVVPSARWHNGFCPDHALLREEWLAENNVSVGAKNATKANKPSKSARLAAARLAAKQAREEARKNAGAPERARAQAARDKARREAAARNSAGKKAR